MHTKQKGHDLTWHAYKQCMGERQSVVPYFSGLTVKGHSDFNEMLSDNAELRNGISAAIRACI